MDVVEFARIDPFVFDVVNLKLHVWWDERRLDRADVVAENFCCRVLVEEIVVSIIPPQGAKSVFRPEIYVADLCRDDSLWKGDERVELAENVLYHPCRLPKCPCQ